MLLLHFESCIDVLKGYIYWVLGNSQNWDHALQEILGVFKFHHSFPWPGNNWQTKVGKGLGTNFVVV